MQAATFSMFARRSAKASRLPNRWPSSLPMSCPALSRPVRTLVLKDATKDVMGPTRAVRSVLRPDALLDMQLPMPLKKVDTSASPFAKTDSGTLRIICSSALRFEVVFADRGKAGSAIAAAVQAAGDVEFVAWAVTTFAEGASLAVAFALAVMMYFWLEVLGLLNGGKDEEFVVTAEILDEQGAVESAFASTVLLVTQGRTELER